MKMTQRKESILNVIGIWFLALGIIAMLDSIYNGNYYQIFWFCYVALILLGIGFILRKDGLILAQLSFLFIPIIVWNFDFLTLIIFDKGYFGITDYFFSEGRSVLSNFITLQHIYTIPLIIYGLVLMKIKGKGAWKITYIEAGLLFIISRYFIPASVNMNCAHSNCLGFAVPIPYEIAWISVVLIVAYSLDRIFIKVLPKKE